MRNLRTAFDVLIRGRVALVLSILASGTLVGWIGDGLSWRRWPDVFAILRSSWLYLLISGAICMSAARSALRRESSLHEAVACLVLGLAWHRLQRILFFVPIPFDIRWLLITYGLAGVAASCLRRAGVRQLLRKKETVEVPRPADPPTGSKP